MEEMQIIEEKINEIANDIKNIEIEMKNAFSLFFSFKDSTEVFENYETILSALIKEIPTI